MASFTRRELKPDDPIFSGQPQIFKPVSRPSTTSSTDDTDGEREAAQARIRDAQVVHEQMVSDGMLAQVSPLPETDESPSPTGEESKD